MGVSPPRNAPPRIFCETVSKGAPTQEKRWARYWSTHVIDKFIGTLAFGPLTDFVDGYLFVTCQSLDATSETAKTDRLAEQGIIFGGAMSNLSSSQFTMKQRCTVVGLTAAAA